MYISTTALYKIKYSYKNKTKKIISVPDSMNTASLLNGLMNRTGNDG